MYLGWGNFATLQHCANPLQIVSSLADTESVVIGTVVPLSPDESKILDSMIMSGLGVALDRKKSTLTKQPENKKASKCAASPVKKLLDKKLLDNNSQPNIKTEPDTVESSNILMSCTPVQRITPLCLILKHLDVQPGDRIKITLELLDSVPSNSYIQATNQWIQENILEAPMKQTTDSNNGSTSDTTVLYWESSKPKRLKLRRKKSMKPKEMKKVKTKIPANVTFNFEVSVHRIHQWICKYSCRCKVSGCGKKFSNVRDWNSHHILHHASLF